MIFFKHRKIDNNENEIEFEALYNDVSIGSCVLFLGNESADITQISYNKDYPFIVEGLIKAAFNFAANRNYYIGICNVSGIDELLSRMNFNKTEKGFSNDIPTILMGSCKECGK